MVATIVVLSWGSSLGQTPDTGKATPNTVQVPDSAQAHHGVFYGVFHQRWFPFVLLASAVGWVLGLVKGFAGTKDWLAKYFPNPPKLLWFILDSLVYVGVGAILGTVIYNPTTATAALAAGITWPVGFGALATGDST